MAILEWWQCPVVERGLQLFGLTELNPKPDFRTIIQVLAAGIAAKFQPERGPRAKPLVETAADVCVQSRLAANTDSGNAARGQRIESSFDVPSEVHSEIARSEQARTALLKAPCLSTDCQTRQDGECATQAITKGTLK